MTTRRRRSRQTPTPDGGNITHYRYSETRKNNPPAGLASQGRIAEVSKQRYSYDPHLPPVLRFDGNGQADGLPELLETALQRKLTGDEVKMLADALRNHQPWLEWTGKREKRWFEVDPVALHIHERVSAQAILKIAARQDVQRSLWADPEQEYHQAVQFYQHDVEWTNRLILGDSLMVMNSLSKRENLAGKVQMIYVDPPYGINYRSNFQPLISSHDVKDREADLTREPEVVKAYRDTWTLGVHSYLAYLRDRLISAKELLNDEGSIFVQIGDENLHHLRNVMDEVFGSNNFIRLICFAKSGGLESKLLNTVFDYILWYAKDATSIKYRPIFRTKRPGDEGATKYRRVLQTDGMMRPATSEELDSVNVTDGGSFFTDGDLTSQGNPLFAYKWHGKSYVAPWKTPVTGLNMLSGAERIYEAQDSLRYIRLFDDFLATNLSANWEDVGGIQSRSDPKVYAVQTAPEAIKRCMLMTTEPGDLVLDPTCGSGTTAVVAEEWGRRWLANACLPGNSPTSRPATRVIVCMQKALSTKWFLMLNSARASHRTWPWTPSSPNGNPS